MGNIDLKKLEKIYQETSSVDQLIAMDKKYVAYLENELSHNPKNVKALIDLGILSWEPFHDKKKGIEYLEKAIELDPKNVDARFWLAKCVFHDCCDYARAEQLLLEALQIDPKRADCLALLASVILDTSESLINAMNCEKKAIEYAPDWPMLRISLGNLALESNDLQLAEEQVRELEKLVCLPPKKMKNGIEFYYEWIVTGRSFPHNKESLDEMKKKIQEAKEKQRSK